MIYNMKLVKEVVNGIDMDLAFIEYKASVYGEMATYLSDNDCSHGTDLINKIKNGMDSYVNNLKNDLCEIENICREISDLAKKSYKEKKDISSMITINKKKIFISNIKDQYDFIYAIGFDEYKKLYKYGIIEANINKGKFGKIISKIGFSDDSELIKYADFKIYFKGLLNEFNNPKSIEELKSLKKKVNNELSELFYTKNLKKYLINESDSINRSTGIEGLEILKKLNQSYDINMVKIKLLSSGYSVDNNQFIELVRSEISCRNYLDKINKLDGMEDKDIKDIYTKSVKEKSQQVEFLMNELNMNSTDLEIAVSKINGEV